MNNRKKDTSTGLLILLLLVFFFGECLGCVSAKAVELSPTLEIHSLIDSHNLRSSIVQSVMYYIPILIFSFFPWGILIIPLIVGIRGYILGCTSFVLSRIVAQSMIEILVICGIPALIQLPSLFYLGVSALRVDLCKVAKRSTQTAMQILIRSVRVSVCSMLVYIIYDCMIMEGLLKLISVIE